MPCQELNFAPELTCHSGMAVPCLRSACSGQHDMESCMGSRWNEDMLLSDPLDLLVDSSLARGVEVNPGKALHLGIGLVNGGQLALDLSR